MKYIIIFIILLGMSGCVVQEENTESSPQTSTTTSEISNLQSVPVLRTGIFEKVNERYDVRGSVDIENGELRFSEDFEISFGPDLFIHFGANNQYDSAARIARLQNLKGSQTYTIPEEFKTSEMEEVWIWCRAFNVGFAMARLN